MRQISSKRQNDLLRVILQINTHTPPTPMCLTRAPHCKQGGDITFSPHTRQQGLGLRTARLGPKACFLNRGLYPQMLLVFLCPWLCWNLFHHHQQQTRKGRGKQKGKQGFLTGVEQGNEFQQPCTPQFSISTESPTRRGGLLSSGWRTGPREKPLLIETPLSIPTLPHPLPGPTIPVPWLYRLGPGSRPALPSCPIHHTAD